MASSLVGERNKASTTYVEYSRDRDLVDPDFSGYKLSLDSLPVNTINVSGPAHQAPHPDMYSFLHVKLFGEHNHLISDPYSDNLVLFIGANRSVYTIAGTESSPCEVWSIPVNCHEPVYNLGLTLASDRLAVVSDGCGTLYILETGCRSAGNTWKTIFQDEICGKNRPFVVRYAATQNGESELEILVHYVEEREKLESCDNEINSRLPPTGQGDSTFLNCIEWISFTKESKGWMMERVRRIVSQGGINYIGLTGGNLALAAEKKTYMTFDSMNPVEEDLPVSQDSESTPSGESDEKPSFYWRQTTEDVEIWFYIPTDTIKHTVKVNIESNKVDVRVAGVLMLEGELFLPVEHDSWTWTLDNGKLALNITKNSPGPWSSIWKGEGPKGLEVTDTTEDTVLAHITSDNPLTGEADRGQPAFNAQELESVDDCIEENSCLVWQADPSGQHVASLAGHQHLFTVQHRAPTQPPLCIRHDVDGFVWNILDCELKHTAVFPALGYVQASKQQRKFLCAPHTCRYSAICDATRHVYIYRQPKPLPAGSELKNRKSGKKVEGVAVQQVVTLDNNDEIFGLAATESTLYVITKNHLYRIQMN